MRSKEVRQLLATVAVTAAVLGVTEAAAAADRSSGGRFHVVTNLQAFPSGACAGFQLAATGTVQGTEMGIGTWAGTECIGATDTGRAALTASDSSQLFLTFVVTSGPPDANGVIYPTGTFTITGGEGRFEGATGGGNLTSVANVFTGAASDTLDGTIRLRAR